MINTNGTFSRKAKKASRLYQKIKRDFAPENSSGAFNLDRLSNGMMGGTLAALLGLVGRFRR